VVASLALMKIPFVVVVFLLIVSALAQQRDDSHPKGVIYGVAIGQDGQPAKGIGLTASPGVAIFGGPLPLTKTNQAGEFRFESLDLRRYTVYAEDEAAGYSIVSTGLLGHSDPSEVELRPEHREAELKVYLPPRAGFVQIHLTNRRTGDGISGMRVTVMSMENPESPLFTMSCYSNHVILVPPDKNLLLHVTSDGFREWDESVGRGKPLHLSSGTRLTLAVQLEPD
jgi:hypothetical protein